MTKNKPYKISQFSLKPALERLEAGTDIICLRTMERISKKGKKISVNFTEMSEVDFIRYYSDEQFFTRD